LRANGKNPPHDFQFGMLIPPRLHMLISRFDDVVDE
jgi:hypothetical protein